jgi:hypothetical protein
MGRSHFFFFLFSHSYLGRQLGKKEDKKMSKVFLLIHPLKALTEGVKNARRRDKKTK